MLDCAKCRTTLYIYQSDPQGYRWLDLSPWVQVPWVPWGVCEVGSLVVSLGLWDLYHILAWYLIFVNFSSNISQNNIMCERNDVWFLVLWYDKTGGQTIKCYGRSLIFSYKKYQVSVSMIVLQYLL